MPFIDYLKVHCTSFWRHIYFHCFVKMNFKIIFCFLNFYQLKKKSHLGSRQKSARDYSGSESWGFKCRQWQHHQRLKLSVEKRRKHTPATLQNNAVLSESHSPKSGNHHSWEDKLGTWQWSKTRLCLPAMDKLQETGKWVKSELNPSFLLCKTGSGESGITPPS